MSGVGVVKTEYYTFAGEGEAFVLDSGAELGPVTVAFETYGTLNASGDNALLVAHALTGDAHVAGLADPKDRVPGWWDPMIGPGRVFDTDKYFVVCCNVLGGCYGSTGPASIDQRTGRPYGLSFPVVSIRDMVRVQKKLVDYLGIKSLMTVVGGSMGGMQVLEWGVTFPGMVRSLVPIATSGKLPAQVISYNTVQRQAIMLDPAWKNGNYYGTGGPAGGLSLARMIGTITYKSEASWASKFGRTIATNGTESLFDLNSRFEIENYLSYQGEKLVRRFDANTYLYLTKAMDLHDVGRGYSSYEEALHRIKCKLLCIGVSSDFLYPTCLQKELVQIIRRFNREARYAELESPYGHDAFLIEFEMMADLLQKFLANIV